MEATKTTPPVDSSAGEDARARRFQDVLAAEHVEIGKRRIAHGRLETAPPTAVPGVDGKVHNPVYDTTGVSLSGGGIRSAAFCLGALQSLAANRLIDQIDYLSTVSGGGYIGSSVSACMSQAPPDGKNQEFPFTAPNEYQDRPAVGHLRDFSNYILPRGSASLIDAVAVILRGLVTNLVIILAVVSFLVLVTLIAYPDSGLLMRGSFLPRFFDTILAAACICSTGIVDSWVGAAPFALTFWLLGALSLFLAGWAVSRSRAEARGCDVRGSGVAWSRWIIRIVIVMALLDLQPLAIAGLFWLVQHGGVLGLSKLVVGISAPFAAVVAFFSDRLAAFVKRASQKPGTSMLLQRLAVQAAILAASAFVPLLLWLLYLSLAAEGMADPLQAHPGFGLLAGGVSFDLFHRHVFLPPIAICLIAWIVLSAVAVRFAPNANSLHQLYRDKLSKAFLFDPKWRETSGPDIDDLVPLDKERLSGISPSAGGPYHLINAAVNLQGSVYANRRGRNADFFLFSSRYVGSDVTDYVTTAAMQAADTHIDLAAAMAISGAAVSSNMGSSSIAPLTPTLALLNVRLGYWIRNPRYILNPVSALAGRGILHKLSEWSKFYLVSEMLGRLDENAPHVYLTDGGHIENLGLYQLLRRHCRVIVAVDGEADPDMSFRALSTVQRYARIDMGIRIDLPWQEIARISLKATAAAEAGKTIAVENGPHCAIGLIHYPDGKDGLLLYVKASVTGDEADYVLNYKQRNPAFPHESTGDQFFTEEQFECYRALGFHAIDGFLTGRQGFAWNTTLNNPDDARKSFWAAMGKTAPEA
jgi:hypothetical protein